MKILALLGAILSFSSSAHALILDSDLPLDQVKSIQYDFNFLEHLNFRHDAVDAETAKAMGIVGELNAKALEEWFSERVMAIVSEEFNVDKSTLTGSKAIYANQIFPDIQEGKDDVSAKPGEVIAQPSMENIGAGVYFEGKQKSIFEGLQLHNGKQILLSSAHHSVIQIQEGLYDQKNQPNPTMRDSPANAIRRLSLFFHEARHSDGNGKSFSFSHAICLSGEYKGYNACDAVGNGAYAIQAKIMKSMIQACDSCSLADKAALSKKMEEYASRVQAPQVFWDATPEAPAQSVKP